jgi:hypothetical protein
MFKKQCWLSEKRRFFVVITDLKNVLTELQEGLIREFNYKPPGFRRNSVAPIRDFIAWIENSTEAQLVLNDLGIFWPASPKENEDFPKCFQCPEEAIYRGFVNNSVQIACEKHKKPLFDNAKEFPKCVVTKIKDFGYTKGDGTTFLGKPIVSDLGIVHRQ